MDVNLQNLPVEEELVEIYQAKVLNRRTRVVPLPGTSGKSRILTTLLGYQLKAGRRRISCPDMATARYLKVFTDLGLTSVRIPYDPTVTEELLPLLETALEHLREAAGGDSRKMAGYFRRIRDQIGRLHSAEGA